MSLRDNAYTVFKQALFGGTISPGQFFALQELCDLLEVSMSPLRDALRQLEAEGLVELRSKKGVRITHIDGDFIRNAFQVRRFLEVQACRDLARSDPWPEIHHIRERSKAVIEKASQGFDEELQRESYEVDMLLHDGVIGHMKNEQLKDIHRQVSDRIRLIRLNGRFTAERTAAVMDEHLRVIDAIIADDFETAALALERHLRISEIRALGKEPDPDML